MHARGLPCLETLRRREGRRAPETERGSDGLPGSFHKYGSGTGDARNGPKEVGVPTGIRTRVLALKGPRPRPLDDGDVIDGPPASSRWTSSPGLPALARAMCQRERRLVGPP